MKTRSAPGRKEMANSPAGMKFILLMWRYDADGEFRTKYFPLEKEAEARRFFDAL